jgi:hypothetical protein
MFKVGSPAMLTHLDLPRPGGEGGPVADGAEVEVERVARGIRLKVN